MHIFCSQCGKHIDVSIEEIENLEGHLVCPQCLASIDVDVKGKAIDFHDKEVTIGNGEGDSIEPPAASVPPASPAQEPAVPASPASKAQVTPPAMPAQPAHVDSVLRYCKQCGAFLREGANFCPKCGTWVRVAPPQYRGVASSSPPSYRQRQSATVASGQQASQPVNYSQPSNMSPKRNTKTSSKSRDNNNRQSGIMSIAGCLTLTVIAVAVFFIIYIIWGVNVEG